MSFRQKSDGFLIFLNVATITANRNQLQSHQTWSEVICHVLTRDSFLGWCRTNASFDPCGGRYNKHKCVFPNNLCCVGLIKVVVMFWWYLRYPIFGISHHRTTLHGNQMDLVAVLDFIKNLKKFSVATNLMKSSPNLAEKRPTKHHKMYPPDFW